MQQQRLTYLKDSYAAAYISAITTECTVFRHSCNGRIQCVVVVEYTVYVQQMTSTTYTGGVALCWDGGIACCPAISVQVFIACSEEYSR